ncbi:MAG: TetR/AcrR family transcriptional regulator, partial [Actinomycetales bacterium]
AAPVFPATLVPRQQQAFARDDTALPTRAAEFTGSMMPFARPEPQLQAAVELIQASQFDAALYRGIREPVAQWLKERIDPIKAGTPTDAAVRAAVTYLGLGLVLMDGRGWQVDLTGEFTRYQRALAAPVSASELPADRSTHLDQWPFDTGDPRMDQALGAMAQAVGEVGYHRATISRICRTAKISAGYLYTRYQNKLAFFLAANDILLAHGLQAKAAFAEELAARYGPGIAEAVVWREFQRPEYAFKRALTLEANRLARFDPQMRQVHDEREQALVEQLPVGAERAGALAYLYTEMAMAFGVYVVPNLARQAWSLPFDTVTVPLLAQQPG